MNDTKDNKYCLYAPQKLVGRIKQLYNVIVNPGSPIVVKGPVSPVPFKDFLRFLLESGISYMTAEKRTHDETGEFLQNVAMFVTVIYHKSDSFNVPIEVEKEMYDFIVVDLAKHYSLKVTETNKKTKKEIKWVPDKDILQLAFVAGFLQAGYNQILAHIASRFKEIHGGLASNGELIQ